ncbi:hypothetical protein OG905_08720 [Streptomyces sp. NBC_00322]|uniref:hypothetical protein n=1 Tax=Streptomyces sp. NBC_00322 TaxID=2975712 RepID=UPI002E27EFF1|nr:hypothetical protein [Streptomyces sp. NBC_00322]
MPARSPRLPKPRTSWAGSLAPDEQLVRIALAVVPVEHRTEGLTWLTTAASAGTALGAPLSGHLIDAYGPGAG